MLLSKTNFLITRDCNKNGWLKVHKPEIYKKKGLSDFDLNIIETTTIYQILIQFNDPDYLNTYVILTHSHKPSDCFIIYTELN